MIPSGVRFPGLATVLAVVTLRAPAAASPLDVVGLTSRHAAQASAGVASADDAAALYYDPAGLVARPGLELSLGMVGAHAFLDHAGALPDRSRCSSRCAPAAARGPLHDRVVIGVALHLLPSTIARVTAPAPDATVYPYYGDRLSRIAVLPGAAVRFGDFAVGAAVDVLAGLAGDLEASEGETRAIDARIDERVPTVARVIAGATWQVRPDLRVGAVYRERFEIPSRPWRRPRWPASRSISICARRRSTRRTPWSPVPRGRARGDHVVRRRLGPLVGLSRSLPVGRQPAAADRPVPGTPRRSRFATPSRSGSASRRGAAH